jgi:hypothetical protein
MSSMLLLYSNLNGIYSAPSCPIKNSTDNEQHFIVNGFNRFDQLNFTKCTQLIRIMLLEIEPDKRIILDGSLNFTGVTFQPMNKFLSVLFFKLKGIEISSNMLNGVRYSDVSFALQKIFFVVSSSSLNFYFNGNLLDQSFCHPDKFPISKVTYLNRIQAMVWRIPIIFPSGMLCPFIFYNVYFKLLSIEGISSSLLEKNILGFLKPKNFTEENFLLNANILQLVIRVYHINLNSNLLSRFVFGQISSLDINGQLNEIQTDLFKSFKKLKILRIRTQNVKGLFSRNNVWLNYLNYDVKVNLDDYFYTERNHEKYFFLVFFQTFSSLDYYDYPDRDFCYFKNFPHERLVVAQLKPLSKLNCSCTQLFLMQRLTFTTTKEMNFYTDQLIGDYYFLSKFYFSEINERSGSKCTSSEFGDMINKCNFKKRLNNCNLIPGKSYLNQSW